jgi:hypothetical protein
MTVRKRKAMLLEPDAKEPEKKIPSTGAKAKFSPKLTQRSLSTALKR